MITAEQWSDWHYGKMGHWAACEVDIEASGIMASKAVAKVTCPKCLMWLKGSDSVTSR